MCFGFVSEWVATNVSQQEILTHELPPLGQKSGQQRHLPEKREVRFSAGQRFVWPAEGHKTDSYPLYFCTEEEHGWARDAKASELLLHIPQESFMNSGITRDMNENYTGIWNSYNNLWKALACFFAVVASGPNSLGFSGLCWWHLVIFFFFLLVGRWWAGIGALPSCWGSAQSSWTDFLHSPCTFWDRTRALSCLSSGFVPYLTRGKRVWGRKTTQLAWKEE